MRDSETLLEELEAIEELCAADNDAPKSSALRKRWDAVQDDLRRADGDAIDYEVQAVIKRRLATSGIELLALMYRESASDAQIFPAILLDVATTDDLRSEIRGAENDRENFERLSRARREIYESPRKSRAQLKAIIKESGAPGLRDAAKAALALPKPVTSAPTLFTFNSVGLGLYGSRDPIGNTVIKTHAICALFIPIIPLSAYRVQECDDDSYYFISKHKLSRFASTVRGAIFASVLAIVALVLTNNYLNSPERQARLAMQDATALVADGKPVEAMAAYEALASRYGVAGGRERMYKAGDALVSLYLAEVPAPVTLGNLEQAQAVLARYRHLPSYVRGASSNAAISAEVVAWSQSVRGENIGEQVASLRLLEQAEDVLGRKSEKIAAMRAEQRLSLAATVAVARPIDGLDLYMEAGEAGWPGAGAILHSLNLSQLHESERLLDAWTLKNTPSEEFRGRITVARATMTSSERVALLTEPTESALKAAIDGGAIGQDLRIALADLWLSQGRVDEALALLRGIGKPGEMVLMGQLALAQTLSEAELYDEADNVLTGYLDLRLSRFQEASRKYNARAEQVQETAFSQAQHGTLPPQLTAKLDAISDEAEQYQVFEEWVRERIDTDASVIQLRKRYDEYSDVVPAVLQQGMVKLQRANESSGAAREAILAEAERSFLAIATDAVGLPSYHLNLGSVYYRLGKTVEGDAEFAELLNSNAPELKLAVAYTFRNLQLVARAREVATKVWENGEGALKQDAAVLLSLLASDLEEQEKWLRRMDQDNPETKIRLTSLSAHKARRAGNYGEADTLYGKVAAYYSGKASHDTASLNNAALANQNRYEVTGATKHLETARLGMDKALLESPDSAIVTSNLMTLRNHYGRLDVLKEWIHIGAARPSSSQTNSLISALVKGPMRDKVLAKLQENRSLRGARSLNSRLQMLSPNMQDSWQSELRWGELFADSKSLASLLARLKSVTFDHTDTQESREKFLAGDFDEDMKRDQGKTIANTERLLVAARAKGHHQTTSALAYLQALNHMYIEGLELDQESAQSAAMLLMESHKAWPELGANKLLPAQLFTVALFRAVSGDDELEAFCKSETRHYGTGPIMLHGPAYEVIKTKLLAVLKTQPEYRQAIVMARKLGSSEPSQNGWLLGQIDDNAEVMALHAPFFEQEHRLIALRVEVALAPGSASHRRKLEIFEENAK